MLGLVLICFLLFAGSISAIGLMYWQFSGCMDNSAIISLTLIFSILVTAFQIFWNEEYSLLTSAIMVVYATYVCYSAVSLNPESSCNPTLATSFQGLSAGIGMTFAVLSITWATYAAGKLADMFSVWRM